MRTRYAAATCILGRDHAVLGRNLQDHAVVQLEGPARAVAVVSDGCGEGEGSELGARIGALVGGRSAMAALAAGAPMDDLARAVGAAVLAALAAVTDAVAGSDRATRAAFVAEHLAATLWIAAARGREAVVFGWGDGVVRRDGRVVVIDQGGRPDYLVRALASGDVPAPSALLAAPDADLLAVATDGWGEDDLRALPAGASSLALGRWMRLRQRDGAFRDDAAVAVLGSFAEVAR